MEEAEWEVFGFWEQLALYEHIITWAVGTKV